MKKVLLLITLAIISLSMSAQDILVFRGGEVENVKVLEVTPTEVKFKKFSNQNGPTFTERRSNLVSVKYENGEVQKFHDGPANVLGTGRGYVSSDMSYYSDYGKNKRFTNEVSLYVADGWGLGWQSRRELSPYFAWNRFGVSYMSGFHSPAEAGLLNLKLLGARGYTPSWKWIRGYIDLNLGVSMLYGRDLYVGYYNSYYYLYDNGVNYHLNFGLDVGAGIQLDKRVAIGYDFNFIAPDKTKDYRHMARISVLF